ncbi:VWA domain-containing protein [Mycobacterium sp. 852002-51961_SCH5331710]|uniref:nitric oxide reductase activation protein NorD n=1 Tax=Mycobacterium sp. 852002-51961_SCH5331710 TaxID=1834105 RepID=UPI0007FE91EF|nr:VWA domain-containing protein [Mycobacterium sp. 852002-51961_SCH5331710]OBB46903.1 VWA domain-containing protein [Mycobacterium sp. 852002-51961_SCH5331710]
MNTGGPERFRFLATFAAGRPVDVAHAPAGVPAHTDGAVVFVSAGRSTDEQRREVLVQSALLAAGSLEQHLLNSLRARPSTARRYLSLEGRRALAELASRLPAAAALPVDGEKITASPEESLEIARGRGQVADPPDWFGVIKPSRVNSPHTAGGRPTAQDLQMQVDAADVAEDSDDDDGPSERSKILKLFEAPVVLTQAFSNFLRNMLGTSRSSADDVGGELKVGSTVRARAVGVHARPLPTRIEFTDAGRPAAALGIGGALHPEWDVYSDRYRPDHCRVLDFPLAVEADVSASGVAHDEMLRRRLSRVGLGPKVLRGRPDGEELDIEALIDLFVDLRSGFSPPEHVYTERRMLARNLGVLILVDASGSATDTDAEGLAVHDHQRRAAATLAATLEELGDRVAVYAFRSQGRHAVHLPAIKTFEQRFGALSRARLNQLQPSGFTRLGAAIRGAGRILEAEAGTPNKLLLVLSDGHPYDDGYEGRYAEADVHKALEEMRVDGVACLCLSIASSTTADTLGRVFGSAGPASAATLAELSPRMDELFLASLREFAAPAPR